MSEYDIYLPYVGFNRLSTCLWGPFLEKTLGTPPRNVTKLFTGHLQPTFKEGTGSFVSGGPFGLEGEPPQNVTKLFNTGL